MGRPGIDVRSPAGIPQAHLMGERVRVVLASASPARRSTLRSAGLDPEVIVSEVDEAEATRRSGATDTAEVVALLARAKADDVAATLAGAAAAAGGPIFVIGCDSMLEFDGAPFGKPGDEATARDRWRAMRGRSGVLRTGHALIRLGTDGAPRVAEAASATEVDFANVSDAEIDAYVATGEPLAVAGAFTIDGRGGWFIRAVRGDHHGVVGISLPLLRDLFAQLGVGVDELWRAGQ
jgi:septum formation protein